MDKKNRLNEDGLTHDQLQAACFKSALQAYHPFLGEGVLHCIPNDMHAGNIARWKQYEALGVTPGVWDMVLHWFDSIDQPDARFFAPELIVQATHWFEFKVGSDVLSVTRINRRTGKKTIGQTEVRDRLLKMGHKFHVIHRECEFMEVLKSIIEPTLHIAKQIWKQGN